MHDFSYIETIKSALNLVGKTLYYVNVSFECNGDIIYILSKI